MNEREIPASWATAVMLLATTGCHVWSAPPPATVGAVQDVGFLRGCWVAEKGAGGTTTGVLRLLETSSTLEGATHVAIDGIAAPAVSFSFALDGSSLLRRTNRNTDKFAAGKYLSVVENPTTPLAGTTRPRVITYVHTAWPGSVLTVEHDSGPDQAESILIRVRNGESNAIEPPITTDFAGTRGSCG